MSRAESMARIRPAYDPANPPPGVKLWLGTVAARLGVTFAEMSAATEAAGCGISRTGVANVSTNEWPVRTDRAAIRQALTELLRSRGATEDELACLFHAQGRGVPSNQPRGPDERAPELPLPSRSRPPVITPEEPIMLLPKQSLTPQARRHFKLYANPFDGEVLTEDGLFVGDDVEYCRQALLAVARNGGFGALVGESGAGKTTLMQDLETRLESDSRPVVVMRPSVLGMEGNDTRGKPIKSTDILHAVITRLDPQATVPQTLQARTVKAAKMLTASAQIGNSHLLLIEEGHSMPDATLKHLKRLHEMRQGRRPLLSILLVAQPELKQRLADGLRDGSLREVAQRIELIELLPLDSDLRGYLQRRAEAHKVELSGLMDDDAINALRDRLTFQREALGGKRTAISMCYPLAVNNLLTKALNDAAAIGAPRLTAAEIKAA